MSCQISDLFGQCGAKQNGLSGAVRIVEMRHVLYIPLPANGVIGANVQIDGENIANWETVRYTGTLQDDRRADSNQGDFYRQRISLKVNPQIAQFINVHDQIRNKQLMAVLRHADGSQYIVTNLQSRSQYNFETGQPLNHTIILEGSSKRPAFQFTGNLVTNV